MRPTIYHSDLLRAYLLDHRIATIGELKRTLATSVDMTIFRKLRELSYRTSYSHRGRYYTLDEVAKFDERGLWSWQLVRFSVHGTLLNTARAFVEESEAGLSSAELKGTLNVEVKEPLLRLVRTNRLHRERTCGRYIYFASEMSTRRKQILLRRDQEVETGLDFDDLSDGPLAHELKAAIVIFFSLLDEKQRRLYAGLESLRLGYGGDSKIAEVLNIDPHTVSNGRRELVNQDYETERVRGKGGGRTSVKKKRRK